MEETLINRYRNAFSAYDCLFSHLKTPSKESFVHLPRELSQMCVIKAWSQFTEKFPSLNSGNLVHRCGTGKERANFGKDVLHFPKTIEKIQITLAAHELIECLLFTNMLDSKLNIRLFNKEPRSSPSVTLDLSPAYHKANS